jgi:hypothetical protein
MGGLKKNAFDIKRNKGSENISTQLPKLLGITSLFKPTKGTNDAPYDNITDLIHERPFGLFDNFENTLVSNKDYDFYITSELEKDEDFTNATQKLKNNIFSIKGNYKILFTILGTFLHAIYGFNRANFIIGDDESKINEFYTGFIKNVCVPLFGRKSEKDYEEQRNIIVKIMTTLENGGKYLVQNNEYEEYVVAICTIAAFNIFYNALLEGATFSYKKKKNDSFIKETQIDFFNPIVVSGGKRIKKTSQKYKNRKFIINKLFNIKNVQ